MVWWKLQSITSIQPSFHDVPIDIHQRKPELPTSVCSRNGSATDHGQTDHGLQPKGLSMVEILKAKQRRWLSWSLYLLSVSHVYSPFFESFSAVPLNQEHDLIFRDISASEIRTNNGGCTHCLKELRKGTAPPHRREHVTFGSISRNVVHIQGRRGVGKETATRCN